jgi:hypothetical protein
MEIKMMMMMMMIIIIIIIIIPGVALHFNTLVALVTCNIIRSVALWGKVR